MSVRVNLLRPEEIRQQTSVSRESLMRVGVVSATSIAVAGLVWGVFQYRSVRHGHAEAKERWAAIESTYEQVKTIHSAHMTNQKYLDELQGWSTSRLSWTDPLTQLQEFVPGNIQLTRLTVQGEIRLQQSATKKKKKDEPGMPVRCYSVRLEGRAIGDMSDQDVIHFVDELRGASMFRDWLASVKLQSLERSRSRDPEEPSEERTFRVDASSVERMIKL